MSRLTKQNILDEEKYLEEMEKIITRDFFPDLPRLKVQMKMLEAMETRDPERIEQAKRKLEEIEKQLQKKGPSLDEYLSKNTSEDNASFSVLLNKMREQQRSKLELFFGIEKNQNAIEGPKTEETKKLTGTDVKMITSGPMTLESQKSALYFLPQGKSIREESSTRGVAPPKQIVHSATGYIDPSTVNVKVDEKQLQQQRQLNQVWDLDLSAEQILLKQKQEKMKETYDLDTLYEDKEVEKIETPKINGWSLVSTPSPMPGRDGETPFMTWGTIEGTPLRIESEDEPKFKMPATPKREEVALKLAEKAAKRLKKKKNVKVMRTPTPNRFDTWSPAAQMLMKNVRKSGFASELRASYNSPSPLIRKRSAPFTPTVTPKRPKIPSTPSTPVIPSTPKNTKKSVTEDLLKL